MKIKNNKPFLIAITGSFGTGKSAVGDFLKKKKFLVVDSDDIVRNILSTKNYITKQIKKEFGKDVISQNKKEYVDHKKLATIVFKSKKKKTLLESIIHPYVKKELIKFFNKNKNKNFIFALIPLLFESKLNRLFNETWCVICKEKIQLIRLKAKGFTLKEAKERIKSQFSQTKKAKLSDFIIDNSFSLKNTYWQVMKRLQTAAQ